MTTKRDHWNPRRGSSPSRALLLDLEQGVLSSSSNNQEQPQQTTLWTDLYYQARASRKRSQARTIEGFVNKHLTVAAWIWRWSSLRSLLELRRIRIDMEWATEAERSHNSGVSPTSWNKFDNRRCREISHLPNFIRLFSLVLILVFLLDIKLNDWKTKPYSTRPLLLRGGCITDRVFAHNEWYRLITSSLLHLDLFHLTSNIYAIWMYGILLEQRHGSLKVALISLLGGTGGVVLNILLFPHNKAVGASVVTFALVGMGYADIFTNWTMLTRFTDWNMPARRKARGYRGAAYVTLVGFMIEIIATIGVGFLPMASLVAHGGGLVCGFCFALPAMTQIQVAIPLLGLGFCSGAGSWSEIHESDMQITVAGHFESPTRPEDPRVHMMWSEDPRVYMVLLWLWIVCFIFVVFSLWAERWIALAG